MSRSGHYVPAAFNSRRCHCHCGDMGKDVPSNLGRTELEHLYERK